MKKTIIAITLGASALLGSLAAEAAERPMGFFVTSVGMGNGADLGGLEGADAHCNKLASAVGAGDRTAMTVGDYKQLRRGTVL